MLGFTDISQEGESMRSTQKTLALWFFLIIMVVFFFHAYENKHQKTIPDFTYSKLVDAVKAGEVASITFRQETSEILGEVKHDFAKKYNGATSFAIVGNTQDEGYKFFVTNGITPNYERADTNNFFQSFLVN